MKPGEPEYERLQTFFGAVRVIDVAPPPDELLAFNDVMGIDPGEAILFSATGAYPDSILVTGDKRSLIALCRAGGDVCGEFVTGCKIESFALNRPSSVSSTTWDSFLSWLK